MSPAERTLMPPAPTLVGGRCSLRALTPADAPAIAHHADSPAVAHNLFDGFPHPYSLQDALVWCGDLHRQPAFGTVWAVDLAGEAIGCISVAPEDGPLACNALVGYWIGQAHWGRGITSQALRLVTAWAWAHLPAVHRLYAPIFARNTASQGVARSAGWVLEATLPRSMLKQGEVLDVAQWACYRPG